MPLHRGVRSISAAAFALLEGVTVHALFHGRIRLMGADADHVQRAEVLAAQIVAALLHRAVDVRILTFVHCAAPFRDCHRHVRAGTLPAHCHSMRNAEDYTSGVKFVWNQRRYADFLTQSAALRPPVKYRENKSMREKTGGIFHETALFAPCVQICIKLQLANPAVL